jgi:hypothetical protein
MVSASVHRVKVTRAVPAVKIRRSVVRLTPYAATLLLTAAIFLLPATSNHRPAQASVGEQGPWQSHIFHDVAAERSR